MSTALAITTVTAGFSQDHSTRRPAQASDLTNLFEAVLRRGDTETITVRELLGGLETSAFGIPLAALAVPEIIPVPVPGVSLVIAIPTAMLGAQMVTARDRVWLPASLLDRRIRSGPACPLRRPGGGGAGRPRRGGDGPDRPRHARPGAALRDRRARARDAGEEIAVKRLTIAVNAALIGACVYAGLSATGIVVIGTAATAGLWLGLEGRLGRTARRRPGLREARAVPVPGQGALGAAA